MNKYGNALLDEYYGMQGKKKITLLHVDYVETFPKNNGSYDSYHTDIDSSAGGGNNGGGGGGCDDCESWSGALVLCCLLGAGSMCHC